MNKQIQAVYEGGVIRPLEPVALNEGEELDVVLLPRHKQTQRNPAEALAEIAPSSIEGKQDAFSGTEHDAKFAAMQEAMNDEVFLSDLRETMEDFSHADAEQTLP
jgi:predicted DNA-binding antitoxin AbrB/MazE fold protein